MPFDQVITTNQETGLHPGGASRLRGSLSALLSAGGAYPALILLAFLMDARRIVAWAVVHADGQPFVAIFDKIDYLTLAEWLFIVAFAVKADFAAIKPGHIERVAGLALAFYALFFVEARSHLLTIVLCLGIAARLALVRRLWPLCACLVLVSLQWIPDKLTLDRLHDVFIPIDAWASHFLLWATGFANDIQGAVLRRYGSPHAIRILSGCDTLSALLPVVSAFWIFALAAGNRLDRRLLTRFVVFVAMVFAANWIRLGLMTLSYDYYLYWHTEPGASILSMAYGVLALVMATAASGAMPKPDGAAPTR